MRKFFSSILVLTFLVALVTYFFFLRITDNSLPEYDQNLTSNQINKTVLIHRDKNGIPFIESNNPSDLYFTIGFIHAQDRLFQMDLLRKMSEGRLSEWFGDTTLFTDIFYRNQLLKTQAEKILGELSEEEKMMIHSYANGVNEFMNQSLQALPIQYSFLENYTFEPWTELHSIMIYVMISNRLNSEVKYHLLKPEINSKNFLLDYLDGLESRMVIVPESRSATGKKIVYIEKRSEPIIPGIYYPINVMNGDSANLTGITVSGIPILFSAISKNRSWITQPEKIEKSKKNEPNNLTVKRPEVISVKHSENFNLIFQTDVSETQVLGHELLFQGEQNERIISSNYLWKHDFSSYHSLMYSPKPLIPNSVCALISDSIFFQGKFKKTVDRELTYFPSSTIKINQSQADSSDNLWLDFIIRKKIFQIDEVNILSEIDDYYYSVIVKLFLLNRIHNLTNAELKTADKYLSVWRAEYNRQDIGSTLFAVWNYHFLTITRENKIWTDSKFNFNDKNSIQTKTLFLMQQPNKEIDSLISVAIIKSVITLKHFFGEDPAGWRYENLMRFQLKMSDSGQNEILGSDVNFAIRPEGYHFITAIDFDKKHISVDQSFAVVRYFGQSGSDEFNHFISVGGINEQLRSPFFKDQLRLWFQKKYIELNVKQDFKYLTRIENEQ